MNKIINKKQQLDQKKLSLLSQPKKVIEALNCNFSNEQSPENTVLLIMKRGSKKVMVLILEDGFVLQKDAKCFYNNDNSNYEKDI
ncbi:hypothetical protein Glove_428g71 [Diversispora epigaea]|uniref:Uncharacterized protein n=1 Tax=Diversispora epigaea TaxID=1348612 RepID=A0A397GXU8_9GLOM|nr:hypothetical protein Glove_428g71 [Diversispora epigaea]